jgi:hypothetical protein
MIAPIGGADIRHSVGLSWRNLLLCQDANNSRFLMAKTIRND